MQTVAAGLILIFALAGNSVAAAPSPALPEIQANDNRHAAGRLAGKTLRIDLEAREGLWYPESHDGPGFPVQAFAERGKALQAPGPVIRVTEGTRIRATVTNRLAVNLAMHGMHTRPGDPKDVVDLPPGERRTIEFEAGAAGTYFYWGSTMQGGPVTGRPLYRDAVLTGALIVDPEGARAEPGERIFVVSQWRENPALDDPARFATSTQQKRTHVINGLAWPYTERLTYDLGQRIRWRWINASLEPHPMHLHGFYFEILALGDAEVSSTFAPAMRPRAVTHRLLHGETMALDWSPDRAGNWLFHCHILDHIGPHTRLRPNVGHAAGEPHVVDHVRDAMAGLVLGVTVRANAAPVAPAATAGRHMKLFVQEQPGRFGDKPALGYVLQSGEKEPRPDTVEIPGPLLLLTRGEHARIEIVNRTQEETSVHWHGMELESYYDGVPGWGGDDRRRTPPIRPGESFDAHMTPPRAGTFIYHTHWHDARQLSSGMSGPLVVLEPGQTYDPAVERMVFISNAPATGQVVDPVMINGSLTPVPLQMTVGNTYRVRLINITENNANLELTLASGAEPITWRTIAKDGADLPVAQAVESKALRQPITTGETRDYEFTPRVAGDLRLELRAITGRVRAALVIEVR
jgi:manganese oxidase